ncbi:aspartic peptidase domain-containing protein [Scheffersomyces xylosifermentans]|uniref:aspartic peptidase domain-containing protein n=1 Tax=Scheffersomyces xylosifermentans TaxID=1304137 RepID=UPI00315D0587
MTPKQFTFLLLFMAGIHSAIAAETQTTTLNTDDSNASLLVETTATKRTTTDTTSSTADGNIVKLTLAKPTITTKDIPNRTAITFSDGDPSNQTNTGTNTRANSATAVSSTSAAVTENAVDKSLFKLMLTIPPDDSYYNVQLEIGGKRGVSGDVVDLRLDLIQPEIWAMNGDAFYDCNHINQWWSSEEKIYSSSNIPDSLTTDGEYLASVCGQGGLVTTTAGSSSYPTSTIEGVANGDAYMIPYMNVIDASGEFATDNIRVNITRGEEVQLYNVTYLLVNNTNMYYGGLGMAGNPRGTGFLQALTNQGIIKSPGYSLWFNNENQTTKSVGQLMPGVVDKTYYTGNLYAFDMIPHTGIRYPSSEPWADQALEGLKLPTLQIDDVRVEAASSGQSISLKSKDVGIPVLLDSRSAYNYLPLEIIVNLAIQTNAYYSTEAGRWLVECDTIANSGGLLDFVLGGLTIKIPLSEFIINAYYQGKVLKFATGEKACFLTLLPASQNGFNSLGLPFITNVFLAVDNEGSTIALANSNKNLVVNKGDNQEASEAFSQSTTLRPGGNTTTISGQVGFIESGHIPFATKVNFTNSEELTLSYSSVASSDADAANLDIPARFSGAIIRSGEIIITGVVQSDFTTTTLLPGMASAASENATSKTSGANGRKIPFVQNDPSMELSMMKWVCLVLALAFSICLL